MDAQIRQILDWSGNPERALHDFNSFLRLYSEKMGRSFDLETVNAKRLLSIFGNSFFLSEWLMKNPEEADRTVESPCIETDKKLKDYDLELEEAFKALPIQTLDSVSSLLRHYKYQEYLRLTLKDLSQAAGIESILSEISDLATCLVQKSLLYLLKEMQSDWGKPENMLDDNSLETCDFQVIAMGKWAGRELNYSSDIDFQLVYSSDQTRIIGPKQISAHEYYVKLTEKLTRLLSEKTEFGFVYRVDLNLRPEGKSGTLANSLSAIEHYYEAFGQEWERQALIKAIPIAGDARLAKEFQSLISPFVWRKTMSLETIHQMKEMKRKVHESISKGYPRGI
ncbi:MAG: hypothetical protein JNK65_07385, partial [Deltaproteobacteria bacterium]|nr:hypothetical protein [Deltaproteobacteria bacterium]